MEIIKSKEITTSISHIAYGSVFMYQGDYYIKVASKEGEGVNLASGAIGIFDHGDQVQIVKGAFVVE